VSALLRTDEPYDHPGESPKSAVHDSGRWHGVPRIVKFGIASGVGLLVSEAILILGFTAFYGATEVPSLAHSSPTILGLDVFAFGIGVTVAFMINERVAIKSQDLIGLKGRPNWFLRWCK
jgi:hypothetical protein